MALSYKYFVEVYMRDHYPFAGEVAEYLYNTYGIKAVGKDKPASVMVTAMLNWIHSNDPRLFFQTKYGLKRVFPLADRAARILVHNCKEPGGSIEINGKKYRYEKKGAATQCQIGA